MKVEIIAFGIAKDIIEGKALSMEMASDVSIADVKGELINRFPKFETLASLKLAVNEDYVSDDYQLKENDEVVLIPPVSGG